MPGVAVMGGSVGGLTAALVLRDAGCDVTVFERSSAALQARGAGIAALEATLRYLTERGGRQVSDVCSSTNWIRFLRADGGVRHEQRHRYLFSSWNTIYRSLPGLFDPARYLLGREVTGFSPSADSVRVTLADGSATDADLLVCADGVSSLGRARLLPEVRPSYSGYVAWRGTLPERALPAATRERFGDAAFAGRPHAAAGTAKAAADGWALAAELAAAGGDVPAALARWERGQLALGQALLARCREIGDSSQFGGTFRPGDQRLIFGLYEPGH